MELDSELQVDLLREKKRNKVLKDLKLSEFWLTIYSETDSGALTLNSDLNFVAQCVKRHTDRLDNNSSLIDVNGSGNVFEESTSL
eukprot:Nk52_evm1s2280 gene=Nk52_evmTU1s2280